MNLLNLSQGVGAMIDFDFTGEVREKKNGISI